MSQPRIVRITIAAAIEAATAAAFEVTDPESPDHGEVLLHCFTGTNGLNLGADWDLKGVVETLKDSRDIAWLLDLPLGLDHELGVLSGDGRMYRFAVKAPAGLEVPDVAGRLRGAIENFREVAARDNLVWHVLVERVNLLAEAADEWLAAYHSTPIAPPVARLRSKILALRNAVAEDGVLVSKVLTAACAVADSAEKLVGE